MNKPRSLLILMLGAAVAGCGSDIPPVQLEPFKNVGPPPPPPVVTADVSGVWYSRTLNNAVNCGMGEFIDAQTIMISQNDTDLSLLTSTGNTLVGTLSGDIIEWTGDVPDRGGMMTYTSATLITSTGTASGDTAWTWSDGTDSCNGTMAITAAQNWNLEESATNSRPGIADVLVLTDGVAFASGVAASLDDKDYFQLILDADASVQVELSHFDVTVSDLDLEIRNVNNSRIALSESLDSFEMIDIDLAAGTYYIGMLPTATPGGEAFYISVDVN